MLQTKICWIKNGAEDSMVLEAETLQRLQEIAAEEIEKRQPDDYWSLGIYETPSFSR